jgi:hypothetical protein
LSCEADQRAERSEAGEGQWRRTPFAEGDGFDQTVISFAGWYYVRADPAGLAAGVLRLHANATEAAALARAGLTWVARQHAAPVVDRALRRAVTYKSR